MYSKKINIGIIQGRLTKTRRNILQKFPKNWEREFQEASSLGYNYIEFFSERKINLKNPIWSKNSILLYKALARKYNLKTYSFVDDFIINHNFCNLKTIKYLKNLVRKVSFLKIKYLILPFYEKSKINENNYKIYLPFLKKICEFSISCKVKILIESNLSPDLYFKIKKEGELKNFNLVIDTGNRINLKRNFYDDVLTLKKEIKHIHIKDKNDKLENVILGKGNVNFYKFFNILKKIKYTGRFTVESTRGNNPIKTAKKNILYIYNCLKKTNFI